MSASFYDLMKYAKLGIASPDMTMYDRLKASALFGGTAPDKTITGVPPLTLNAKKAGAATSYKLTGNGQQISPNLVDPSATISGYQESNGNIHAPSSKNERTTDWIPFEESNEVWYIINGSVSGNLNYVLYDESKQPLYFWGESGIKPNVSKRISKGSFSNTKYIRISWTDAAIQPICVTYKQTTTFIGFTPTPDAPIEIKGVGDRTANLFDEDNRIALMGYIDYSGTIISNSANACVVCKVEPSTSYTISADMICTNGNRIAEFSEKPIIGSKGTVVGTMSPPNLYLFTITTGQNTKYIAFHRGVSTEAERLEFYSKIMLNLGNTALPYEPYGYKIQMTSNGTPAATMYLGQTQTVRRVKKLVLDGTESWTKSTRYPGSFYVLETLINGALQGLICTHAEYTPIINETEYIYGKCAEEGGATNKTLNLYLGDASWTTVDFKAYLDAQYASGMPVTVWYVLAEPETAIVNEPLMKIGDYADELHSTSQTPPLMLAKGVNVIYVDTTVEPTSMSITGQIK